MIGGGLGHSSEMAAKTRKRLERISERSYFKNKDKSVKRNVEDKKLNIRKATPEEMEVIRYRIEEERKVMIKKTVLAILLSLLLTILLILGGYYFFFLQSL